MAYPKIRKVKRPVACQEPAAAPRRRGGAPGIRRYGEIAGLPEAQSAEGAGMYVALKDLEIRGAGNLLGGEQSGHIAGVGFDLYVRMIGEAVNELKGDGPAEKPVAGQHIRFAPVELPDSRQVRVQRLYPKTVLKSAVHAMLVPAPRIPRGGQSPRDTAVGGKPLQDRELLAWCGEVIRSVLADR